jgi:hypothetical protein
MQLPIWRYCCGYANKIWNRQWPNTIKLKFVFASLRKDTKKRERKRKLVQQVPSESHSVAW